MDATTAIDAQDYDTRPKSTHQPAMTDRKWTWVRVTREHRCPVCAKPDWCEVCPEHNMVLCMRVQGPKESKGGGWLHPLGDAVRVEIVKPKPCRRPPDFNKFHRLLMRSTLSGAVVRLARLLGIPASCLMQLQPAWYPAKCTWLFPMRDGYGNLVGMRCRDESGHKWALKGSHNGIFIPQGIPVKSEVWICEGPTDTAAALAIGHYAVGRPDCNGGCDCLQRFCRLNKVRSIVIAADRDLPGQNGAKRLAERLNLQCRTFLPPEPYKDIRAWVQAGAAV